jgi:hypothetical protein
MTHYTRKGYAYTGVSLIPQGCVKISFADYLLSGPIRILNTQFYPTMSCMQPSLPMEISLCHNASAKIVIILLQNKKYKKKREL